MPRLGAVRTARIDEIRTGIILPWRAFCRRPRAVAVTTRPPRAGVPAAAVAVAVAAARVAVLFELFGHPARRGLGVEAAALAAVVAMRRLEVAAMGGGGGGARRPFDLPRKRRLTYKDLRGAGK